MADYTSRPYPTIFEGKITIPDRFLVTYRAASDSDAAITITGLLNDGTSTTLVSSTALDSTQKKTESLNSSVAPVVGYYYTIANNEDLIELDMVTFVTKQNTTLEATLGV